MLGSQVCITAPSFDFAFLVSKKISTLEIRIQQTSEIQGGISYITLQLAREDAKIFVALALVLVCHSAVEQAGRKGIIRTQRSQAQEQLCAWVHFPKHLAPPSSWNNSLLWWSLLVGKVVNSTDPNRDFPNSRG
jgi:hypothetical protein